MLFSVRVLGSLLWLELRLRKLDFLMSLSSVCAVGRSKCRNEGPAKSEKRDLSCVNIQRNKGLIEWKSSKLKLALSDELKID